MSTFDDITHHRRLSCGIDLVVQPLPDRPVAAMEIRLPAGFAFERPDVLGVAHVLMGIQHRQGLHGFGHAVLLAQNRTKHRLRAPNQWHRGRRSPIVDALER